MLLEKSAQEEAKILHKILLGGKSALVHSGDVRVGWKHLLDRRKDTLEHDQELLIALLDLQGGNLCEALHCHVAKDVHVQKLKEKMT